MLDMNQNRPAFKRAVDNLFKDFTQDNKIALNVLRDIITNLDFTGKEFVILDNNKTLPPLDYLQQKKENLEDKYNKLSSIVNRINKLQADLDKLGDPKDPKTKQPYGRYNFELYKSKTEEIKKLKEEIIKKHFTTFEILQTNILPNMKRTLDQMSMFTREMVKKDAKSQNYFSKLRSIGDLSEASPLALIKTLTQAKNEKVKMKQVVELLEEYRNKKFEFNFSPAQNQNQAIAQDKALLAIEQKLKKLLPEVKQNAQDGKFHTTPYMDWLNDRNFKEVLGYDKTQVVGTNAGLKHTQVKFLISKIEACDRELKIIEDRKNDGIKHHKKHGTLTPESKAQLEKNASNVSDTHIKDKLALQKELKRVCPEVKLAKVVAKTPIGKMNIEKFDLKPYKDWVKKSTKSTNIFKEGFKQVFGHHTKKAKQREELKKSKGSGKV